MDLNTHVMLTDADEQRGNAIKDKDKELNWKQNNPK